MPVSQFQSIAPFYDELMHVVPYDFWAEYVIALFEFVGHQPQKVLDCACGTGNLSFELSKQGLQVTGVDLSDQMITEAKNKNFNVDLPYSIEFLQGNLATFNLDEKFDCATCLYDSLNYILDNETIVNAFRNIRSHIQPSGIFVFDLNAEWAFEANLFTQSSRKSKSTGLQYNWRAKFDEKTRICTVHMNFEKRNENGENTKFVEIHRERAYSIDEITSFLHETGWQLRHIFDAYTFNRPHSKSERWFFVASA